MEECEIDEDGKFIRKGETINSLSNFDSVSKTVQLRDHSRKNLNRLGVLYSDSDQISSPIQRTEENFCEKSELGSSARPIKKFSKLISLASDINSYDDDYSHRPIKNLQRSPSRTGTIPKTNFSSPAKSSPFKNSSLKSSPFKSSPAKSSPFLNSSLKSSPAKSSPFKSSPAKSSPFKFTSDQARFGEPAQPPAASTSASPFKFTSDQARFGEPSQPPAASTSASTSKKLLWDKKVMDSLEAQGFTRRESTVPKMVYDYSSSATTSSAAAAAKPATLSKNSPAKVFKKPVEDTKAPLPAPPMPPTKLPEQRNVRFSNISQKNQKDPADLSLKDRMAIFEKNKGTAPVPKTPYGIADANPIRSNLPELSKKFHFGFGGQLNKSAPVEVPSVATTAETAAANVKKTVSKLLTGKGMTISEQQINESTRKQREEDMKCLLNRFNKPEIEQETSEDEPMHEEKSERKRLSNGEKYAAEQTKAEVYQKSDDKKRSRVLNPPRMYPILSDIESNTDSEMDNYTTATVSGSDDVATDQHADDDDDYTDEEDVNLSFGREILNTVQKSHNLSNVDYLNSTVSSQEVSDAIGDMDDYLNEALEGDESKGYDDEGSACSHSFQYERPKRVSFKDAGDIPFKTKLEISPSKNPNGSTTLVHTVSFYRRQQSTSASNTPVKKVVHKSESDDGPAENLITNRKAREECYNKIQRLLEEVMRQQTIISQTSQALNLCASTVEFSGSTEAVEGERHLLVATNRRMACLNEVQRLKVEGMLVRVGAAKEKGTLQIKEITIPLKQTYISRLANDEINGHHLLCLVKYNEYVLATRTLPTLPGLNSVKFQDLLSLNEVHADFKITLEIYGMTAQREILPHDIKYHIQTPNKKRFKSKLQESNLTRPPVQSPGGPNAVRTPSLVQYGYIIFSIRELKQKSWVINETAAGVSPLNGNVYLKIDSRFTVDVDHCGFLTMFDDISGFGAWHRRWCRLSGNTLYHWKYPEDEKKKEALGQLDLTNIISERVEVAPRSICARLHTILLESRRERRAEDVETLVRVPKGNFTTVR